MEDAIPCRLRRVTLSGSSAAVEGVLVGQMLPCSAHQNAWGAVGDPVASRRPAADAEEFRWRGGVVTTPFWASCWAAEDGCAHRLGQEQALLPKRVDSSATVPAPWYSIPSPSVEDLFGSHKSHAAKSPGGSVEKAPFAPTAGRRQCRGKASIPHCGKARGGISARPPNHTMFSEGCRDYPGTTHDSPRVLDSVNCASSGALVEQPGSYQLTPGRDGERGRCRIRKCLDASPSLASVPTTAEFLTPLGARWGAQRQPPLTTDPDGFAPNARNLCVLLAAPNDAKKPEDTLHCARDKGDEAANTRLEKLRRLSIASEPLLSFFSGSSVASAEVFNCRSPARSNGDQGATPSSQAATRELASHREGGGVYFDDDELVEAATVLAQVVQGHSAAADRLPNLRETLESVRKQASETCGRLEMNESESHINQCRRRWRADDAGTWAVMKRENVGPRNAGLPQEPDAQWTGLLKTRFRIGKDAHAVEEKKEAALLQNIVTRLIELVERIIRHPHLLNASKGRPGHCHSFSSRLVHLLRLMQRLPLEQKEVTLMWLECWMCLETALQSDRTLRHLPRSQTERRAGKAWKRSVRGLSRCRRATPDGHFKKEYPCAECRRPHTKKLAQEAKQHRPAGGEVDVLDARGPHGTRRPGALHHRCSVGWAAPGSEDFFYGQESSFKNTKRSAIGFQGRRSTSFSSSSSSSCSETFDSLTSPHSHGGLSSSSSSGFAHSFHGGLCTFSSRSRFSSGKRPTASRGRRSYDHSPEGQSPTNHATAKDALLDPACYEGVSSGTSSRGNPTSSRTGDGRLSIVPPLALGDVGAGSWLGGEKTSGETYVAYDCSTSHPRMAAGNPAELTL